MFDPVEPRRKEPKRLFSFLTHPFTLLSFFFSSSFFSLPVVHKGLLYEALLLLASPRLGHSQRVLPVDKSHPAATSHPRFTSSNVIIKGNRFCLLSAQHYTILLMNKTECFLSLAISVCLLHYLCTIFENFKHKIYL